MATEDKTLARAAAAYLKSMDPFEIPRYFLDASTEALYRGDSDSCWVMRNLVNGPDAYGDHLKANASILLIERPQILKYFPDEFNRTVASRAQAQPAAAH